jgi:hypothetical protein
VSLLVGYQSQQTFKKENIMKNLVLALVVSFGLAACDGTGLPGVDAVDAGVEAVGVDGGACTQQLAARVYGDNWKASTALAPPAGVNTLHAVVYMDGAAIPRECWSIDSIGSIRVNPAVFPDAGLHSISFTFECAVKLPANNGLCI